MLGEHPLRKRLSRRRHRLGLAAVVACAAALTFTGGVLAAPGRGIVALSTGNPHAPHDGGPIPRADGVDLSARLERRIRTLGKADFAIEFRDAADLSKAFQLPWKERGRYVHERLRETAERSQAQARRILQARGVAFEPYWIKNVILVRQGDLGTLAAASRLDGVQRIRELPAVKLVEPDRVVRQAQPPAAADGVGENIARIGAPEAWAQGVTGNGVTVGVIDNGFLYSHQALVGQYRGNHGGLFDHEYNWLDPGRHSPAPTVSDSPHGTHVVGTILGDDRNPVPSRRNRIGVAPGAQWMSCLGIDIDTDNSRNLLGCGQFMLAPTRTDGTAPDPDLRPQIVNNSWSEGSCDGTATPFYKDVIDAWIAAGLFPAFAAGNTFSCDLPEPQLSTVSSPAALASAFAVGSTGNHDGQYASHSLWGPTNEVSPGLPTYPDPRGFPQLKPQVVAPGVDIRSAVADSDEGYVSMTGTSMSTPHVTGVIALMLEAGECLRGDYATLGTILMQTARAIPYDTGGNPAPGPGDVPNYATGWGEIDAAAAVAAAANACGPQGFVAGKVTGLSGGPVAAAKVELFTDANVKIYQTLTETDGRFRRRLPQSLSGGYTMRVTAYGYLPSFEAGLLVANGQTTQHDTQLAAAPVHKISGRVTDANTGWPLHARVRIGGYPGEAIWTDPATGTYSVRLAEGVHYRFDVDSDIRGYVPTSRDVPDLQGGGNQDFGLSADLVACSAPGYRFAQTLLDENFEQTPGAPPAGWSRSSAGLGWLFGEAAELSGPLFAFPAHGRFAAANDELGAGGGWQNDGSRDFLTLPVQNLAGLADPVLHFASYAIAEGPRTTVEASLDGGATWSVIGTPKASSDENGWTQEAMSLAGVASNSVLLRFHSDDGTSNGRPEVFGGGWGIDDVRVAAGCIAPSQGGLVVGQVRDANTGAPLNGATVSTDDDATSSSRSADASIGDGFFAIHALAGAPRIEARRGSLPAGYGDASATPAVADGKTVRTELKLPAARLRLYPAGPAGSVELGTVATVPFTVTNSGTQDLHFAFERAAVEEHFDGSAFPPAGWEVQGSAAPCGWRKLDPYYELNTAGGDGSAATIRLFQCGTTPIDTSLITPPLDLSGSRTASLGFFLSLLEGVDTMPRFDVDVSRDGLAWTTVSTYTSDVSSFGPGALIELDLTPFVGSSGVRVRFRFRGTPPNGEITIDQVHLFDGVSTSPMLDLAPEDGTLAAGASRTLDATFDARTVTQPGVYTLPLRVVENTPYEWPFGDVEATMTVTAPAGYGSIGGVVRSLGHCDVDPRPLGGVTVTITPAGGTPLTVTTAADGSYRYWVEAARGPYTVGAAAADHLDASRSVTVDAGGDADGALDLRPLAPCLLTDPAALSASVGSGQSLQLPFTLLNAGAAPADWSLRTGGDPGLLSLVHLSQTSSPDPVQNFSFGCVVPGTEFAMENSYMRVFRLAERGLPEREVLVSGLSFAVNSADSPTGTQPLDLRLHALHGELRLENLELLREKRVEVANAADAHRMSVVFDQPLSVRGDTVLVAEMHIPGIGDTVLAPGGNDQGETAPAYWVASACSAYQPTPFAEIGEPFGAIRMILEIDTQASDPCGPNATPVDWVAPSQTGGHLGADAGQPQTASFSAGNRTDGSYQGSMCIAPGERGAPVVVPVTLHVGQGGDAIFADGFD